METKNLIHTGLYSDFSFIVLRCALNCSYDFEAGLLFYHCTINKGEDGETIIGHREFSSAKPILEILLTTITESKSKDLVVNSIRKEIDEMCWESLKNFVKNTCKVKKCLKILAAFLNHQDLSAFNKNLVDFTIGVPWTPFEIELRKTYIKAIDIAKKETESLKHDLSVRHNAEYQKIEDDLNKKIQKIQDEFRALKTPGLV